MATSDDRDNTAQFEIPDDIVGEYGGKWVAQVGGVVIASGDSVRDVMDSTPETEERPTIWRVPTSEQWKIDAWWLSYDSTAIDDDEPTVCTVHKRFVPCRPCQRDCDELVSSRWSSDPDDVEAVVAYHSTEGD